MSKIVNYTSCPCCGSGDISTFIKAKDYTVTNEIFEILKCSNCTVAFTQNIPVQSEIGKYYQSTNYISHSDTQDGFISKIYHKVRNLTLQKKKNLILTHTQKKSGNILDIGAGIGAFVNTMKLAQWNVLGLEPDDIAISNAKNKYGLELQSPDNLFSQSKETFDAITLWHVLEHIHTLQQYLQQFHSILKSEGKLFIAVPNYTSYDAQHYKEYWAGYDVPRHLYHFSPKSMELLAAKNNFKICKTYAMWFDSTYVAMLSEQYKTSKQSFIKALFVGMLSNVKAIFNSKNCSSVIYVLEKV